VPARVWKAAFRGLMADDHTKFLADVTAPTLILWGTEDSIFSAEDQAALRAALPGATFIAYEGAGQPPAEVPGTDGRRLGLLSEAEKDAVVSAAAQSSCGK